MLKLRLIEEKTKTIKFLLIQIQIRSGKEKKGRKILKTLYNE